AVVGGGRHRAQVGASLGRFEGRAGELPVRHPDAVPRHRLLHRPDVVGADLVPEPARPGVDHDADLVGPEPEHLGHGGVVDLGDPLELQEVVARAQAADLTGAPLDGAVADLAGVGVGDGAGVLAAQQVPLVAVAALDRVPRAAG